MARLPLEWAIIHPAPPASSTDLLDDLVVTGDEHGRGLQPDCLRGLEIERKDVAGGLLERQIAGLLAAKDAIRESRGAFEVLGKARAVRHQAAVADDEGELVDRRHAALPGEVDDTLPIEIG